MTAEAEYAATKASVGRPSTARPSTAKSSITTSPEASGLAKYIPKLLDAIEKERTYVEDEFQAQVCLGWIHWKLGEPALAAGRLPKSIEQEFALLDGTNKESAEWTKVCALKGSYIKGDSQYKTGNVADALETFESGLPIFATVSSSQKQGKELRIWTELFLTGFCMLSSNAIKTKITSILETRTLSAFRAWAKFWETQGSTIKGGHAPQAEVSRRRVWREYYTVLSDILQRELPFPTTDLTVTHPQTSTRLLQRAEMKRVEASYEALLLSEIQFPRAEEFNEEVEIFVELVMQNWRVICGSTWTEQDLGEGGSEAISRGVLDILYRAATKTFHSTAILRDLFIVHLAVAEFEIAIKAFDTYMDIVKKGKSRVDKTGEPEPALDDDETVLVTGAECIKALCRYGSRSGAEKAKDIGHFFEDWLEKHHPIADTKGIGRAIENGKPNSIATTIRPQAFALAWRSIGIAHAQWARLTFEASSRSDIQLKAIKCFRNSLLPQFESTTSPETRFALGTILAERRELAAAIEVVKAGLLPHSTVESSGLGPHPGRFARERTLIPLWHLMALLLSARQEFVTAARSCEGAFEQFQEPRYLFGEADLNYRSDHLNEKSHPRSLGVIDYMDDFEKRNVLEVKMTQLALIEVLEGPEVAVNASDELLSLYARLFGDPQRDARPPAVQHDALRPPPKSSAGTLKSIKGSIFGRPNRSMKRPTTSSIEEKPLTLLRPNTTQTIASPPAPSIQVTNENGGTAKQHHHLTKQHPPASGQTRSQSLTRRKSSGTARTRSTSAGRKISVNTSQAPTTVDGEEFFTPPDDSQDRTQWIDGQRPPQVGVAVSPSNDSTQSSTRPLPPKSQQMPQKEKSLKPASSDPAKAQDNRLPSAPHISVTNPVTRFSKDQQRRGRVCILVKVWLQIAGFYRRGAMYEDANGAIQEAYKLVQSVDAEISKLTTPDISVSNPGWGAGKSVKELWGDVFAEVSISIPTSLWCTDNTSADLLPLSKSYLTSHSVISSRL